MKRHNSYEGRSSHVTVYIIFLVSILKQVCFPWDGVSDPMPNLPVLYGLAISGNPERATGGVVVHMGRMKNLLKAF